MSVANLVFEYDPRKAAANLRTHGVSFDEAITSFFDTNAISEPDPNHSTPGDERLINIGKSTRNRLLFVVHNEEDGRIRIISARLASPTQRSLYEES
ncbi:BrnT family toxin [Granulicella sp. dw_53]|uniref:BrnT family toxin n=1 Tax=Granulicella sp. dw_53 TaxID=2719792 RepID=UPI001BD56856|nr:BrnT family toxin [Granulicella sp. dw_53]